MQKNYIYLLFYLIYSIIAINCKTFTKDEVLSFPIKSCKEDKDCPSDSTGCEDAFCKYHFYCKNNECLKEDDPTIYGIPSVNTTSNQNDKIPEGQLAVEICKDTKESNDTCTTFVCLDNSQCLSNSCNNGTCISNESTVVSFCSLSYKHDKIKCGRVENERCKNNSDCYLGSCDNGYCSDIISDTAVTVATYSIFGLFLLIGIFFIALALFLFIFIIRKRKNNKN